jgi:hypothetical protein
MVVNPSEDSSADTVLMAVSIANAIGQHRGYVLISSPEASDRADWTLAVSISPLPSAPRLRMAISEVRTHRPLATTIDDLSDGDPELLQRHVEQALRRLLARAESSPRENPPDDQPCSDRSCGEFETDADPASESELRPTTPSASEARKD